MIISKILKIHNGKIFCNCIKSEITASNPAIIIPITTGNIVNNNIKGIIALSLKRICKNLNLNKILKKILRNIIVSVKKMSLINRKGITNINGRINLIRG